MTGIKWYSLENILKYDAQYYIIFGERSNGKSYAVNKYMIDKFFQQGEQFAYVKRYEEDIKQKYMSNVFAPLEEYVLEKYGKKIKFYRGTWLAYDADSEGKLNVCEIMGYAFSLTNVNRTKSTSYPQVTTILFEEFMSIDCQYLPDEINLFLNLVSTIARYRHNVKIFMLANAISKYSPYSESLGIKLHRIKKGEIVLKEFKDKKGFSTKFAIERTENVNVYDNSENKEKVVYNIFGNAGVGKMITTGDFETHKYKRKIDNVTFFEYADEKDVIISKKDALPFVIRFEDYFYRIYLKLVEKYVLGFREIEEDNISNKNTKYIINGYKYIPGITNINNLAYYDDANINRLLNIFVMCMRQGDFITLNDDAGENVVNAFRLSGINL